MKQNVITWFLMLVLSSTMGSFIVKPNNNIPKTYAGEPLHVEGYKAGLNLLMLQYSGGSNYAYRDFY